MNKYIKSGTKQHYNEYKNKLLLSISEGDARSLLINIIHANEYILAALDRYINENKSDKNAINLFTLTPQYIYMQNLINQTENKLMYHLNQNQEVNYTLYTNICKAIRSEYIKNAYNK